MPNLRQHIASNLWQYATGALALVLVICVVALAMQMRAKDKDEVLRRNRQLEGQLAKRKKEIVSLVGINQKLRDENQRLRDQNTGIPPDTKGDGTGSPEGKPNSQGNERGTENQTPITRGRASEKEGFRSQNRGQNPLTKGETEINSQGNENPTSRDQLTEGEKGTQTQITRAQDQTAELLNQNEMLRAEKEKLRSENQMLLDENKALGARLQKLMESDLPPDIVNPVDPDDGQQRPPLAPASLQRIFSERSPQVRSAAMSKNNQASIAFNKKQYNKAIDLFQDAVKSEPKSAVIHYNLGSTYLAMREKAKAIECLREAVALDPKFKEAHYNLALLGLGEVTVKKR